VNKSTKVALDSLGCKLNQAETELFARQLAEAGYTLVSSAGEADIYILNTCTVTRIADRKSRHLLRLAHRQNPGARLVAIGCYAERSPQELAQIDGLDLVLGNEEKPHLLRWLQESGFFRPPLSIPAGCHYNGGRTRAFIKVQDGCHSFCTYCIVPLVRKKEESVPVDGIIAEIRRRVTEDAQEVVLTGTKIGSYHDNGVNLGGLLKSILAETDITRLRLSSLQPQEISPELLGLWRDSRLCPHFHLSLQSGSDTVLGQMKRHYTTADYQRVVSLIRGMVPEAAITTDVIVGFPGETEAEFQQSYNFCRQVAFARIHVFPYSPRQETEAARMPHQVADKIKRQRSHKMLALAEESVCNFRQRFLGKTMPVLWEKQSSGIWSGLTANYIKVYAESSDDLTNKLQPVKLVEIRGDGVRGTIANS
jgi:threonylcarbamoyladenosine tRNA methylthiotransferase MtaB